MIAGVTSYKLCPINYDCEHYELDKVMRSQVSSRKIRSKAEQQSSRPVNESEKFSIPGSGKNFPVLFFPLMPGEMREGIYLHPSHLWAQPLGVKKWRVGADELLAYILPRPAKLQFSDLKNNLTQDQVFGKMLSSAELVFLSTLLSGHRVKINPRLAQHPELVQQDPYGEGWLTVIEWTEDRPELEKFFTGISARRYLQEEAQHLNFFLGHRGVEVNQIGDTLPDGRVDIKCLRQVLPDKVCFRLANEPMVTGKQGW